MHAADAEWGYKSGVVRPERRNHRRAPRGICGMVMGNGVKYERIDFRVRAFYSAQKTRINAKLGPRNVHHCARERMAIARPRAPGE